MYMFSGPKAGQRGMDTEDDDDDKKKKETRKRLEEAAALAGQRDDYGRAAANGRGTRARSAAAQTRHGRSAETG